MLPYDDGPRATAFPDLNDFLNRAPDDQHQQIHMSPAMAKDPTRKSRKSDLKEINEDGDEIVLSLNQEDDLSMEFDENNSQSKNLTVNLGNLVDDEKVNSEDDNKSMRILEEKGKSQVS